MKWNRTAYRRALKPLFVFYSVVMLWLLFGQRIGFQSGRSYFDTVAQRINLIPLSTVAHQISLIIQGSARARHCIINLGGNVILFIPLGLLMPCIWRSLRNFGRFVLAVAIMISAVEIIQLFSLLGSMDIDDLILNLCGASIGFALLKIANKVKNK
ncbi:MAG: VanZ family protein [Clostridia bacterium]|nr:VanZ family protein [Clostridia bacterium]MBQ4054908.1 VanZ family protein [Clostridia bacterium]